MKNDNAILLIIGIIIIAALVVNSQLQKQEEGMIGLNVHYYQDGKEVFPKFSLFSIVTPPGGSFSQIGFNIDGSSTNISFSNIQIVGASPSSFLNTLPITTQTLSIGQSKTLFTSSLIDTAQFEAMSQPVRFWVNISAVNDYTGETEYSAGFVDLTIEGETCAPVSCSGGEIDEGIDCVDGTCTRTCSYYTYSCTNPTIYSSSSGNHNFDVNCPSCYQYFDTSSVSVDRTNYCWKINSQASWSNIVYKGKTVQVLGKACIGNALDCSIGTAVKPTSSINLKSYTRCFRPSSSYSGVSGCNNIDSGTGTTTTSTIVTFSGSPGGASSSSSWSYSYTRYTAQSDLNYNNKVCTI